jgi:hypothetical protein
MPDVISFATLKCQRVETGNESRLVYRFSIREPFDSMYTPPYGAVDVTITPSERDNIVALFDDFYSLGRGRGPGQTLGSQELVNLSQCISATFFSEPTFEQALLSRDCAYLQIETNDPEIPWELALLPGGEALGSRYATTTRIEASLGTLDHQTLIERRDENAVVPDDVTKAVHSS